jgi:hypothetical protein
MGSTSFKQIAGGLVIAVVLLGAHFMPTGKSQPLRHDHKLSWDYVKVPHSDPTPFERRLGDVASFVAERPVQVRCEDFPEGDGEEPGGVVQFNADGRPADFARIRPDLCTQLLKFARAPERATLVSAQALQALTHESMHLRGIPQEYVAECYAMQAVPRVAHALGASEAEGRRLARIVFAFNYPHMPPEYRSADCHPGGSLDEHPGGGWPD